MLVRTLLPSVLVFLLLPATADAADEKSAAAQACAGKTEGAPCSADRIVQNAGRAEKRSEPGSCQPDECCELDYSQGSPPKSTCGPCLACKPGGAPATSGDGGATGVEPPVAEGGEPPAVTPNEKRGCSIATNTTAESALWLLGLSVLGWRRRR